jgi:hypothetical protein
LINYLGLLLLFLKVLNDSHLLVNDVLNILNFKFVYLLKLLLFLIKDLFDEGSRWVHKLGINYRRSSIIVSRNDARGA